MQRRSVSLRLRAHLATVLNPIAIPEIFGEKACCFTAHPEVGEGELSSWL